MTIATLLLRRFEYLLNDCHLNLHMQHSRMVWDDSSSSSYLNCCCRCVVQYCRCQNSLSHPYVLQEIFLCNSLHSYFVSHAGTGNTDCVVCPAGRFLARETPLDCQICAAGKYQTSTHVDSEIVCQTCVGRFILDEGQHMMFWHAVHVEMSK